MITNASTMTCPLRAEASDAEAGSIRCPFTRAAIFFYGLVAYASFFGVILYAIGFVGNWVVPKSIDSGEVGPMAPALAVNGAVLLLFAVQHTVMARGWFKRWITRFIPAPAERSTFVIAASACLALVFWQWRAQPGVVWEVTAPWARMALSGVSLAGWAIVLLSSFMVSHWDLFGLRQVWLALRKKRYESIPFRVVGFYRVVRHPLMVGFFIAIWATPSMTVGHLFFALVVSAYILVGIRFEERDLVAHLGERYLQYRRHVPGLIPVRWRR